MSGKYCLFSILIMGIMNLPCQAQQKNSLEHLKEKISERLAAEKGFFAIAFKDLQTGETIFQNEHSLFHPASTMKTPVMVEAFKEAAENELSFSDSILLKNEFMSIADSSFFSLDSTNDSEKDLYQHLGEKRSISQLLYKMITISSNFSTNLLVEKLGASRITETMHDLGLGEMQVLRGVEDNKAYDKGLNSVTTAYDLMLLFEKLGNGQLVSAQASAEMIRILEDQRFNEIIPAELPLRVKVAHKTGSFPGVHHDSGLVILPDGRKYVLVLLSKDLKDEKSATRAMADISAMIYKYVHRQKHAMHY